MAIKLGVKYSIVITNKKKLRQTGSENNIYLQIGGALLFQIGEEYNIIITNRERLFITDRRANIIQQCYYKHRAITALLLQTGSNKAFVSLKIESTYSIVITNYERIILQHCDYKE